MHLLTILGFLLFFLGRSARRDEYYNKEDPSKHEFKLVVSFHLYKLKNRTLRQSDYAPSS